MSRGTAVIVGVGPGLGLAIARAFHTAGHPVAMLARTQARLDGFADELAGEAPVAAYAVDVLSRASLRAGIAAAVADLGTPEVLVYNAAFMRSDTPTDRDDDGWSDSLVINVLAAKVAAEAVLPHFDGRGSLLFTGGGLADDPSPAYASLSVGKAALRAYVKALAAQQAPRGVHAGIVTIAGAIDGGSAALTSSSLAQAYLELHNQSPAEWQDEILCR